MTFTPQESIHPCALSVKIRISTIMGNDEIRLVLNYRNFIGLKSQRSKPPTVYVQHFAEAISIFI